jgi:hypothetical protein
MHVYMFLIITNLDSWGMHAVNSREQAAMKQVCEVITAAQLLGNHTWCSVHNGGESAPGQGLNPSIWAVCVVL